MDKHHFNDYYNFRTRYLHEFNECFATLVNKFEKILQGKELDGTEKGTLKQYGILREIATLSSYTHLLDEKMQQQLPLETIQKCKEIVDYFERKKEDHNFKPNFFTEETNYIQLKICDYYLKLNQLISLDLQIKNIFKPDVHL